ncbi:hypothetical protein ABT061_17280 [Streptosporangium sp. NPDC002544]|uniref:hypothetical protein n=1 Tax=Streptosporangium sp. NPDC002544 TaxID=3154538 RepID=UPI00331CF775
MGTAGHAENQRERGNQERAPAQAPAPAQSAVAAIRTASAIPVTTVSATPAAHSARRRYRPVRSPPWSKSPAGQPW